MLSELAFRARHTVAGDRLLAAREGADRLALAETGPAAAAAMVVEALPRDARSGSARSPASSSSI